ncbi:hypothetical protein RFI_07119 [Reticulomyxa filosa]|uniref:Uncharacterized protein n=1 Tax=Reticulomyxa filosa TaxID=46433 RepID=X6NVG3_RETFI|nr:hypothetical protein RFI_07119 [Reticulomyxa filosa]|eukprot:ETO30001.1 hypothetical protein RFI_07119 [Reticulomyxa filosa]
MYTLHIFFFLSLSLSFKEFQAMERAIYQLSKDKDMKEKLKKNFGIQAWKPKLLFAVVIRQIVEKIADAQDVHGHWEYTPPVKPYVIQDGITSEHLWDALFYLNIKSREKAKPTRLVVLRDEIGMSLSKQGVQELYQFLHTLCYGYAFALPFQMGPTGISFLSFLLLLLFLFCRIVAFLYAQHYSKWIGEMVLQRDTKVSDLSVLKSSRLLQHRPMLELNGLFEKETERK